MLDISTVVKSVVSPEKSPITIRVNVLVLIARSKPKTSVQLRLQLWYCVPLIIVEIFKSNF